MNKTNKDGDYIDATFVRIIPHNSPCQDDEWLNILIYIISFFIIF